MSEEDHYCVRWKGFHSNIVSALGDLKSDLDFVDVTLSCEGRTIQGHKVILSASSPYFRKILKDNPCRHPVLILNDIQVDILEAITTYMYNGAVSVPHHKLQAFLKTADALRIKGIVDCFTDNKDELVTGEVGEGPHQIEAPLVEQPPLQHPAGDLSLLASAATEIDAATSSSGLKTLTASTAAAISTETAQAAVANSNESVIVLAGGGTDGGGAAAPVALPPNPKRRKTLPRKLGSYMSSPARSAFSSGDEEVEVEKENHQSLLSLALTNKDSSLVNLKTFLPALNALNGDQANEASKVNVSTVKAEEDPSRLAVHEQDPSERSSSAINLSSQKSLAALYTHQLKQDPAKSEETLDLSVKTGAFPPSSLPLPSLLPGGHLLNGSGGSPANQFNFMSVEGGAAEQMAAILGPEQMAALLGPSWKSRQPRMCQYCNRMFSNKFNLKQHILNMHTVGREMSCEICNKKVKNKWYLRRHHVTHHGAPLKK